jgi:hypothetical protein
MAPSGKRSRDLSDEEYREDSENDPPSRPVQRPTKQARRSARISEKEETRREANGASSRSALLRLPGELRNTVYELVTEEAEMSLVHDPDFPDEIIWYNNEARRALA